MNLEISDYWELLALHNVLMEAKFHENPFKPEIQHSPYVQNIANKVFEALVNSEFTANGLDKASWLSWREADKDRREVILLINKISTEPSWSDMSKDERIEYIRIFMAPLILEEKLEQGIAESSAL